MPEHVLDAIAQLGHYRLVEQVGTGGMGVVYRAWDQHLERDVAVKVLPPHTLIDDNARKRFRKEAHSLSKLNHPNIATIHDFDTQDNIDYLVMEFVPGKTLREKISEGPMPEPEMVCIAVQLAEGLSAAHERGLVHRDLKPANVRLTLDGRPKILDFGLVKLIRSPSDLRTTEPNITGVAGTLPYMAPEQVTGGVVDKRCDLFSFGVVLYEMATGQLPFRDAGASQMLAAILSRAPMQASEVNPGVSAATDRIISKCLEKDPAKRYQSAADLATDLRTLSAGVAVESKWLDRLRTGWSIKKAVAVLGLAAVFAATGLLLRSRTARVLSGSDTLVLADFVNSTPDPVFDDTLNQALTVELEQSPFLKILPQSKIRETLPLMGHSPDDPVTLEVGREVCQRSGGRAVLGGSIASLGSRYVIGLTAVECSTGNHLATEQIQSDNKEGVLNSLAHVASSLRRKLGESLSSVQRFDAPLEQATTPSLEALKSYSQGRKMEYQKGSSAAIPLFKRAIELDPNFAVAYAALAIGYSNLGEPGLANENFRRAYDLRDRVSERERLRISAYYHSYCTGDLINGNEIYQQWAQAYPRDGVPLGNMGVTDFYAGQYEKAIADTLEHLRLEPDDAMGYGNLVVQYAALSRFDEAKSAYEQAGGDRAEEVALHANRYGIAFLEDDVVEMERQVRWSTGKVGAEDMLLSLASDTEAFYGHLSRARLLSLRAVDSARRSNQPETAAGWQMNSALREAEFGNAAEARRIASAALALAATRDAKILAAVALARAGVPIAAQKIRIDLAKRYPRDTLLVSYWLPSIDASIEIDRRNPSKAIEILGAATPYELGQPYPMFQVGGSLYPVYLRGYAFLMLHQGVEAAGEFQKILDHRGIVMNCPFGALAHLGLARAYALQGQGTTSRSEYEKFLTIWKDADANIPLLNEAKAEFIELR